MTEQPFIDTLRHGGWVLAFDTAEDYGSVALARLGPEGTLEEVVERVIGERRQQASQLVPTIRDALAEAQKEVRELGAVIVGAGPGSFTGVRVSASTAKGLVFGTDVPLWGVPSLAGAAHHPAWGTATIRSVAFDARGDRLYAASFSVVEDQAATLISPMASTVDEFGARRSELPGPALAGTGATRHRDRFEAFGWTVWPEPAGRPSAVGLIRALALDRDRLGPDNSWDFEPQYLRGSSAIPLQPRRAP